MKTLTLLFCLIFSLTINGQIISTKNFDEGKMNEVLIKSMYNHTALHYENSLPSLRPFPNFEDKVYECFIKKSGKMSLDDLGDYIYTKVFKKHDTRDHLWVTLIDDVSPKEFKTYQEVADKCLNDWKNNPSDNYFLGGQGIAVNVTSYYNKGAKKIFISLTIYYDNISSD